MIKNIFSAFGSAAHELTSNSRALVTLVLLYAATLAASWAFFATREATVTQLVVTLLLAVAAPVLLLVTLTISVGYDYSEQGALALLKQSLKDFWKLFVVSLPLILIGIAALYLLGKIQTAGPATARAIASSARAPAQAPLEWKAVAVTATEYLLFWFALPLVAVHLWIATTRDGLKMALKGVARTIASAFAPSSILIYVVGFSVFAVAPYFLVFTKTPAASAWVEVGVLGARLALAAVLSLLGWVITARAMVRIQQAKISSSQENNPQQLAP
jgi:hypothetical protein